MLKLIYHSGLYYEKAALPQQEGLMESLFQIKNEFEKKDIDKLLRLLWKYGSKSYFHLALWKKILLVAFSIFLLTNDVCRFIFPFFMAVIIPELFILYGHTPPKLFSLYCSCKSKDFRNLIKSCPLKVTHTFYNEYMTITHSSLNGPNKKDYKIPYDSFIAFRNFDNFFLIFFTDNNNNNNNNNEDNTVVDFLYLEDPEPLKHFLLSHQCHIFEKDELLSIMQIESL